MVVANIDVVFIKCPLASKYMPSRLYPLVLNYQKKKTTLAVLDLEMKNISCERQQENYCLERGYVVSRYVSPFSQLIMTCTYPTKR
jgi:hypothetical protein